MAGGSKPKTPATARVAKNGVKSSKKASKHDPSGANIVTTGTRGEFKLTCRV